MNVFQLSRRFQAVTTDSPERSDTEIRLSGEQKQLREAVRKFAEQEVRPVATEYDAERLYRDAATTRIRGKTAESRRNTAAREPLDEGF